MPSRPPTVSRREVLVGIAVLAATAATSAGCGSPPPPPDLDDLTTALDRARADARLAGEAAAATARGSVAQTLTQVAGQRSAHAAALSDEIVRLTGQPAPTTSVSVTTSASVAAGVPPAPAPTADDVIGSLRASADSAAHAAATLSGYRAGLLASIAASCTAAYTVALASPGGAR